MVLQRQLLLSLLPAVALTAVVRRNETNCEASALPTPGVNGASILSLDAVAQTLETTSTSFCNITLTYTHPGQNDHITVWLALPQEWNGRFQGVGGGGWITGLPTQQADAISRGYAAVSTDGGHTEGELVDSWAMVSPGNVNLYALQNFASVALNDMTVLGKQLTEAYYGKPITKSYWNGCSTGGRQGLMMAQRYPDAYDGIMASAPAINWAEFIPAMFWPQWIMAQNEYFPPQCELDAIVAAATSACDELDGLKDNVIGLLGQCTFDASTVVGQPYACGNITGTVSSEAADVVNAVYTGAQNAQGQVQWPGLAIGSPANGIALTTCDSDGGNCSGSPFPITTDWHRVFLQKNASFDTFSYTQEEWDAAFHASVQQYTSIIGTSDADLSEFKRAGGKIVSWHGTTDELIPFNGSVRYYERVLGMDANATDFYRFYPAPGVQHCDGGLGAQPTDPLAALVSWVEDGVVPETLAANRTVNGTSWKQELCLYPLSSIYKGGDPALASSFQCE